VKFYVSVEHLGGIICDLIPINSEVWQLYIVLLQIIGTDSNFKINSTRTYFIIKNANYRTQLVVFKIV